MDGYYDFEIWESSMATRIALVTSCGVMSLIGILGNLVIPVLVAKISSLRTTVNRSLAVLSIADLIYLLYQPVVTMNWEFGKDDSNIGESLCYFILFYERGGVICTMLIFLFISLERYVAICRPLMSLYYWSGRRSVYCLLGIVAASIALSTPTIALTRYEAFQEGNETLIFCYSANSESWMKAYITVVDVSTTIGAIPTLLFIYASIIRKLTKKKPLDGVSTNSHRGRIRTILMLLTAVAVFVVCRFPRMTLEMLNIYYPDVFSVEEALVKRSSYIVYWIAWIMLFINSQVNPLLILGMSSSFRAAFKETFCRCCRGKDARNSRTTTSADSPAQIACAVLSSACSDEVQSTSDIVDQSR